MWNSRAVTRNWKTGPRLSDLGTVQEQTLPLSNIWHECYSKKDLWNNARRPLRTSQLGRSSTRRGSQCSGYCGNAKIDLLKELFYWCAWPPLSKVLLPPSENLFVTAILQSPVHPQPTVHSIYECRNNWPLRLSDDTTSMGDLETFFPDTGAFTDL